MNMDDDSEYRELVLPRVKIRPFRKGFRIGSRVEVRPRNEDELFYPAMIISREIKTEPTFSKTFTVIYDDGDVESGLKQSSMIRYWRRRLYHGEETLIDEGAIVVNGVIRRVRLLHFQGSIGIYQTGLLMASQAINVADCSILPFEVNQAMICGLAMYYGLNRKTLPRKVCCIGLGGGAVPTCMFRHVYGSRVNDLELWAVDLSGEVIAVAKQFFDLPTSFRVVQADGVEFLRTSSVEAFDLIILDIADVSDRFLPPKEFLDPSLLRRPCSHDDVAAFFSRKHPVLVMNALRERDSAPFHVNIAAAAMSEAFPTSYCMTGDPNCVFMGANTGRAGSVTVHPEEMLEWIQGIPGLSSCVPGVIRDLSQKPRSFWRKASSLAITQHLQD